MSTMKVDKDKVEVLAFDIAQAIEKHLNKTHMTAAEIQLALIQVIYQIGRISCKIGKEKALHEKPRVAA